MSRYGYEVCSQISEAVDLLQETDAACLLAGGTDLIVGIRGGKFKPQKVVDIKKIDELKVLKEDEDGITIGAGVTLNEILKFKPVLENVPILAEGCHSIGTYSIRNRATLVGNICTASPAADSAPALLCLDAKVNIVGKNGKRTVAIEEFFTGPGKNALQKGELVTSVLIPKPFPGRKGVYTKASRTKSVDLSTVGVAVQKVKDEVRVALGAVAPTPIRAKAVEKAVNQDQEGLEQAAAKVKNEIAPISDLRSSKEYREHVTEVLVYRCLKEVLEV